MSILITSNQSSSRRLCCHLLRSSLLQVPPKQLNIALSPSFYVIKPWGRLLSNRSHPHPREHCSRQASQPQSSAPLPPPHYIKIGLNKRNWSSPGNSQCSWSLLSSEAPCTTVALTVVDSIYIYKYDACVCSPAGLAPQSVDKTIQCCYRTVFKACL